MAEYCTCTRLSLYKDGVYSSTTQILWWIRIILSYANLTCSLFIVDKLSLSSTHYATLNIKMKQHACDGSAIIIRNTIRMQNTSIGLSRVKNYNQGR